MFNKAKYGVPRFYPRDLKKRVDDYVVGQDRAKKTICATIFNHYQNVRRRRQHEQEDRKLREKLQRQRYARDRELHDKFRDAHPTQGLYAPPRALCHLPASRTVPADIMPKDDYPGHLETTEHLRENYVPPPPPDDLAISAEAEGPRRVKVDKSNILVLGPTGTGKTYILE